MTQPDPTPRRVIQDLAIALESVLTKNDWKPDWHTMTHQEVIDKLHEELAELDRELRAADDAPGLAARVQFEALDVVACGLIAWDRARTHPSQDRGRV